MTPTEACVAPYLLVFTKIISCTSALREMACCESVTVQHLLDTDHFPCKDCTACLHYMKVNFLHNFFGFIIKLCRVELYS